MNVAFVTPFYNGSCDGRFGRFHDWVHTLRDMKNPPFKFDVVALTSSNPDQTLSSHPHSYLGDGNELWGSKLNKLEFIMNLQRIRRDLRKNSYDIIHILRLDSLLYPTTMNVIDDSRVVLGPNVGGWSPIRRFDHRKTESTAEQLKRVTSFRWRQLLASRARYDIAISFSDYHQRILAEIGFDPRRVRNLHPGVETIFSPDHKTKNNIPTLLYVGDLTIYKGYNIFLHAVEKISQEVNVLMAGQGTPDVNLIQTLNIGDMVTHLGFVERQALPKYYNSAELLVVPSMDEMGPNTIVEALACGTPVVATDRPGINEYPPVDASILFSPRNADALASALDTALSELDTLTAAANKHAPEFRADRTVKALDDIYREILNTTLEDKSTTN